MLGPPSGLHNHNGAQHCSPPPASTQTLAPASTHTCTLPCNRPAATRWQVKELNIALPELCACKAKELVDPQYTAKCCKNCPLYGQPARYEQLLTFVLRNADVI